MGLIKAIVGATGGVLADQWKEFFTCDALSADVLVKKGQKQVGSRSSNTKGSDNVISNGSGIAVADGQCMMIVEQGKVVDVCAEPGEYTYDTSTEPSIFAGKFGKSLVDSFKTIGKRFTFGGDTAKDQRVYYFNTKEILDNKFGTPTPIPFRVVDSKIGLDMDMSLRCNGVYSYTIENPILFYQNVCGNVESEYRRAEIDEQLKTEFISALMPAIGRMSELELRPNQLMSHTKEMCAFMNEELTRDWLEKRGIKVEAIALNPISLSDEDAATLKQAQQAGMLRDPGMAAATLAGAQAEAMKSAAANENGAMTGFMGMGMAAGATGINAGNLYAMNEQNRKATASGWNCACGATATGNFCPQCGAKKPTESGWTCACGQANSGNFCSACGAKKPTGGVCPKCGYSAKGGEKFCPECGSPMA